MATIPRKRDKVEKKVVRMVISLVRAASLFMLLAMAKPGHPPRARHTG